MTPVGINRVGHISSSSFLPPIYPSPYLSLLPSFLSYSFYFFLPLLPFFYVCVSLSLVSPFSLSLLSPLLILLFLCLSSFSLCVSLVSPFSLPLLSLSLLSPILLLLLFLCLYVYFYFLPYFLFLDRFGDHLSF